MTSEKPSLSNSEIAPKNSDQYFLGHLLFAFRKSKGMTQITMVKALGMDTRKLEKIESNQLAMNSKLLKKIQTIWNLDLLHMATQQANQSQE